MPESEDGPLEKNPHQSALSRGGSIVSVTKNSSLLPAESYICGTYMTVKFDCVFVLFVYLSLTKQTGQVKFLSCLP